MKYVLNIFETSKLSFEKCNMGTLYSGSNLEIANQWGAEKLGFHLQIIVPKKFGCPYHRHYKEEELFIVISGKATIRQNNNFFKVRRGDLFFFKTGMAHQIYNSSKVPFLFFALSSTDSTEICDYPDSNKKMDVKTRTLTQNGIKVDDYWKDEDDPRKFWPSAFFKTCNIE